MNFLCLIIALKFGKNFIGNKCFSGKFNWNSKKSMVVEFHYYEAFTLNDNKAKFLAQLISK